MGKEEVEKLALELASKSLCNKRKVGAVITDKDYLVLSSGYNFNKTGEPCEDSKGNTVKTVVHAEIEAINGLSNFTSSRAKYIFVTYEPCSNCQKQIDKLNLEVVLVTSFMKFDTDKLKYSLVPPEAIEALASVLTYGAKKYKPNNWKKVDNPDRYIDALYRHLEAWRKGERLDSESDLPHLAHAMANIAFLYHFETHN